MSLINTGHDSNICTMNIERYLRECYVVLAFLLPVILGELSNLRGQFRRNIITSIK